MLYNYSKFITSYNNLIYIHYFFKITSYIYFFYGLAMSLTNVSGAIENHIEIGE